MLIKDKITPQIKNRFLEEIRIAKANGRERGFFLCKDEKGEIIPSRSCEGEQCTIIIEDPFVICPKGFKGDIRIEPYVSAIKREYQKKGIIVPSEKILKEMITQRLEHRHEEKGLRELPAVVPSYIDTLNSLLLKCYRNTDATTCVGSDLEEDKIECWTPKKEIKKGQCIRALYDQRRMMKEKEKLFPKKWIVPLFDKEIINLKGNNEHDKR